MKSFEDMDFEKSKYHHGITIEKKNTNKDGNAIYFYTKQKKKDKGDSRRK